MRGALTGIPIFLVTHMLFADDFSIMPNVPYHMQCEGTFIYRVCYTL